MLKVSTVIPSHNSAELLPNAVNCVLRQAHKPVDILILDDCSTDNTQEVIKLLDDPYARIRCCRYETKSADWVKDLYLTACMAEGDFIHSLAADDLVKDGFYHLANQIFNHCPNVGYIYSRSRFVETGCIHAGEVPGQISVLKLSQEMLVEITRKGRCLGGAASILSRKAWEFLVERRIWELGPLSDAIGYAIIASRFDSFATSYDFGAVRWHPSSGRTGGDEKWYDWCEAALRFLSEPRLADATVVEALKEHVQQVRTTCCTRLEV